MTEDATSGMTEDATSRMSRAKNILENHRIEVTLKNEFVSGAAGLLAPIDTWVELWIINDIDEDKANIVLAKALKQQGEYDWFCWQCQTEKAL